MRVRDYGTSGPQVVVIHGGPGAPGGVAPVARELGGSFRVLEPFQRGSSAEPLTVARHVADLHELIQSRCGAARPALVGHSWGAMLALAYAADYPQSAGPLVLIGCGTFDPLVRSLFQAAFKSRMDDRVRAQLERLEEQFPDPNERLRAKGELILPLYSYDLISEDLETEACDARSQQESWDDMLRLQAEGVYPAAFSIASPVLMLHGGADPHPGRMILASLKPYLPEIEYREWERCGHYPWLERAVRDEFFAVLRDWLAQHATRD